MYIIILELLWYDLINFNLSLLPEIERERLDNCLTNFIYIQNT